MLNKAELPNGTKAWACFAVFDRGGANGEMLLPLAVVFADEPPTVEALDEAISDELPEGRWTYEVEPVSALSQGRVLKLT